MGGRGPSAEAFGNAICRMICWWFLFRLSTACGRHGGGGGVVMR